MKKSNPLATVARTAVVLGLAVTALAGLVWGGAGMRSAGFGAVLACANLWVLARLAGRAIARARDQGTTEGILGPVFAALGIKMLVLFALVWVAVAVLGVAPVPFAAGLSVLVVSLVGSGLWVVWRGNEAV
jgi:hypothetical protein